MHVCVAVVVVIVIVDVMVSLSIGVMGWLGDISHLVMSVVGCQSPCTRGSFRYLLSVGDDTSVLSINTSSVMLLIPTQYE